MPIVNDFCRDSCPYSNKDKYPETKYCKILDYIDSFEDCPAFSFAKYTQNILIK